MRQHRRLIRLFLLLLLLAVVGGRKYDVFRLKIASNPLFCSFFEKMACVFLFSVFFVFFRAEFVDFFCFVLFLLLLDSEQPQKKRVPARINPINPLVSLVVVVGCGWQSKNPAVCFFSGRSLWELLFF